LTKTTQRNVVIPLRQLYILFNAFTYVLY